jgi:hypothetical protein
VSPAPVDESVCDTDILLCQSSHIVHTLFIQSFIKEIHLKVNPRIRNELSCYLIIN